MMHDAGLSRRKLLRSAAGGALLGAQSLLLAQGPDPVYINAPYVPSSDKVVRAMLKLAGVNNNDIVYDLGCGDGRIVILAAKEFGAHGIGIDLNPKRIEEERGSARTAGDASLAK